MISSAGSEDCTSAYTSMYSWTQAGSSPTAAPSGGDPLRLKDVKVTSTRWPGPARKMYRHWREWFAAFVSSGALKVPLAGPPDRDTNVWSHSPCRNVNMLTMSSAGRKSRTIRCIPAPTLFDLLRTVVVVVVAEFSSPHLLLLLALLSSLLPLLLLLLPLSLVLSRW